MLLWQSHIMRTQANRLMLVDEQFTEVLRVHDTLMSFRARLSELARARNIARLRQELPVIRKQLTDSVKQTQDIFRGIPRESVLDPTVLPTLETIQGSLPSQLDSFASLAEAGDWNSVNLRVEEQVEPLENLSGQLVDSIRHDVEVKRAEAADNIGQAQLRTLYILSGAAGITLIVAAFLGLSVTRSITRPLRSLMDGASALAGGDFNHRVPVAGQDELAHLAGVFNQTTVKLRELYREVQTSEAYLSEAQRLTHTGSWAWRVSDRKALYLSDEWYRIYSFDPNQGMPGWEERLERVHPEDREKWRGTIEEAIHSKSDYDVEFRILLPDEALKWIHTVGHPVLDAKGELVEFVGSSTDITERKHAEDELRAAFDEIKKLKDQLFNENVALREEIDKVSMFEEIVG